MITKPFFRNASYACSFFLLAVTFGLADSQGPNLFPAGTFDNVKETYNPWAGVDGDGNIHGLQGTQLAVGDDGSLYGGAFGPSVAVGDLDGDGKPDLVVADSRGFFWYFPNTGTVKEPKFTRGQIIPIWLGENVELTQEGTDNIVPRIQLVDLDNEGKLSLVVGTYAGKLFYVPNRGSATEPNFPVTKDPTRYLIGTHLKGKLWCNYLAPFLYPFYNSQLLDLVMGEGTYSANSIYLLRNMNANITPDFSEENTVKIIPGMGLEQLTPTVVDWNNDKKPDILCGDRTGDVNLFLNTSTDDTHPTFDAGTKITIGGLTKFGAFTTVTTGDLTGNKLPNLLIGTDAGTILYAKNTGKLGAPDFSTTATPIKGVNPFPKITVPTDWARTQPPGVADELVTCVNPQLEAGFAFPTGETTKYAMKFGLFPIEDPIFHDRYYPNSDTGPHEHVIGCTAYTQPLSPKKRYILHLWVKAESSVQNLRIEMGTSYWTAGGPQSYGKEFPISAGSSWTEITTSARFNREDKNTDETPFGISIRFGGQGTFYVDDISITEDD